MLKIIFKYKFEIIISLGIIFIFFFIRLTNLTILPVFADEAIYIRWSQVMRSEPTLRFLPLSDGKQPLFMWVLMPILKFISDPLFAGRFLSVLAGFGTLIGVFIAGFLLFKSRKVAIISSLIYAIVPYAVFFDRMALVDSMLAMFGIWVFICSILLVRLVRLDLAMISGIFLGFALLTKSTAIFYSLLLPAPLVLLLPIGKKEIFPKIIKMIALWLVVYLFAYSIYNVLRLGPNFDMIARRNADYVFPVKNILYHPFDPFFPHLVEIGQWFSGLLTWPVLLAGITGFLLLLKNNIKVGFLILVWLAVPLLVQAEYAKVFTARYIFFTVPLVILFSAYFFGFIIDKIKFKPLIPLLLLILIWPLWIDRLLLINPRQFPLPRRERSGYLEEWTAGTGIKEAADYVKQRAKDHKVLVGTEGFFGTLPDGLAMYLQDVPNMTVIGVGLNLTEIPPQLISSTKDNEVYLLINDDRLKFQPQEEKLQLIAKYPKETRPNNTYQTLLLFMVK